MALDKKTIYNINSIAIPLILSSVSGIVMSIIDQALIGRISIDAYAGVGLVSSSINSLIGVLGAFSIAFNIKGSKAKGDGNKEELNKIFSSSILLNVFIGTFISVIIVLFCKPILNKYFGLQGDSLIEATKYIKIYSISIVLNLLIFVYSTIFKIFRNTKNILKVTTIVNIINLILDYCLVFGKFGFPKLGSEGAALGTVIALLINLIAYIIISRRLVKFNLQDLYIKSVEIFRFSSSFIGQEFMEDIVFIVCINAIVAHLGILELSTYTLLSQVISIVLMPMFGYSSASLSLISEYYSKNNISTCISISKIICYILILIYFFLFGIIILLNDYIPSIITSDKSLIQFSTQYLYIAIFIQIFNYTLTVYKSSLQAIGYEKWTLKATFFINCLSILSIVFIGNNLFKIYCLMGASYIISFVLFYFKYTKHLKDIYYSKNILR